MFFFIISMDLCMKLGKEKGTASDGAMVETG